MTLLSYNYKKGSDFPVWQWLPFFPGGTIYHGYDTDYDGFRYIYVAAQYGSSSTSASTTALWRFDTWGQGWQYMAALTSGNRGLTLALDRTRNVLIIAHGAGLTSWQIFNLNKTSISICGVSCPTWTATTMTPVLPAGADYGATILTIDPSQVPAVIEGGIISAGTTATAIIDNASDSIFTDLMIGLQLRLTSGTYNGQKRIISAVTDANNLALASALGGAPSAGDTYVIELPQGTATAGAASTLTDSGATWITNQYSNWDVVITAGTGVGQKRRIASNTGTVLTLAAAVTGNPNTGNWATAPDATSQYKIQMSSDFMYYQCGSTSTGFYKIDLATGSSAPTWTTLASISGATHGGANILWSEAIGGGYVFAMRGNSTANFYLYSVGLNSWSAPTYSIGAETFTTGASSTMWLGERKVIIHKESTTRLYALNLGKKELEPLATLPYAAPGGYDGHRARMVVTPDGVKWLYIQRAAGQEFFRVPLEWGVKSV